MSLRLSDNLTLTIEAARRVFAFLAIRGAGKTWAAAVLAEEMVKAGIPIIVLDPMGVWWGLRVGYDGKGKGLPVVVFGGDHADLPLELEKAEKLADALIQSNVSCVIDISELTQGQTQRFIPRFLDELRRKNTNDRHVFIEEADVIAPQKPMRDETVCLHAVDIFVRRGGNRNLGCTLLSQRSAVVNKNVLTQSDFMVAMRTNAPQDKEAVAAWAVRRTGDKKALNEWLDSLSDLKDGEAYVWGPDMNVPGVKTKFRMRETFHATRENLKRFDASKIHPMPVGEFIERFRDVFEGRSTPKHIPAYAPKPLPTQSRLPTELPTKLHTEVSQSGNVRGNPAQEAPANVGRVQSSVSQPDTREASGRGAGASLQTQGRASSEEGRAHSQSEPPSQIDLEHEQMTIRVSHTEKLVSLSTKEKAGQLVYVLMNDREGQPSRASEIEVLGLEHGWNLDHRHISEIVPRTFGAVVFDGTTYRLARFVKEEVSN